MRLAGLVSVLLLVCGLAHAEGQVFRVPTRPDVTTTLFWETVPSARATLLLLPGGDGGFGRLIQGRPDSPNFLVRSTPLFVDQGVNVAIFGRPSDAASLDHAERISERHLSDLRAVLAFVKSRSDAPVWVVGTSRGTVSATAMALHMQDGLAGLVLSSSVVSRSRTGSVPGQALATLRLPVLVLHHARDACAVCRPHEVPAILEGLTGARVRKLVMAEGGGEPRGDACGPWHWHGFVGMEREAVGLITDWIQNPTP